MNNSIRSTTTSCNSYNNNNNPSTSIILKQLDISPTDIETEDVIFYAKLIGIDPISEPELLWIAKTGLLSSLPDGWQAVEDRKGRLYYYDQNTKKSSWEHPSDPYYRCLVKRYRQRFINSNINHNNNSTNNYSSNSLILLSGYSTGCSGSLLDNKNNSNQIYVNNSGNSAFTKDCNNNNNSSYSINAMSTSYSLSNNNNGLSSSIANLHFFDDDDDDDHDYQDQNDQENGMKKSISITDKIGGGNINNQWVTITSTAANNSNKNKLPSSNVDENKSKGEQKQNQNDNKEEKEEEDHEQISVNIESVEFEIENPDQSLIEEISEDDGIQEILVVDEEDQQESIASLKETKQEIEQQINDDNDEMVTSIQTKIPENREIQNDVEEEEDNENALIHSDLMNNLIQEDLFNKNYEYDDDEQEQKQQNDSTRIFNDRFGNHQNRPKSAMKNFNNDTIVHNNDDEKTSNLSIVHEEEEGEEVEESNDSNDDEPKLLTIGDLSKVDRSRMSQMGPIKNHQQKKENITENVKMVKKEVATQRKSFIVEQINEQHQSLNNSNDRSDGIGKKHDDDEEKEKKEEEPEMNEQVNIPNVDDIDLVSVGNDYESEEFDSIEESNSRTNDHDNNNERVIIMEKQQKRFNEITKQMQLEIIDLREQLQNSLNKCNESLRIQMNEEIVPLRQRIESIQKEHNNDIELLSKKILEINLSLAQQQQEEKLKALGTIKEEIRIQKENLDELIKEKMVHVMNELNENLQQKIQKITLDLDKTINKQIDNVSMGIEQKLAIKQEQMLIHESFLRNNQKSSSESINRDQIIEIAKQLYERLNEEFRTSISEIRQLCSDSNKRIEMLKMAIDQDRNFSKVNFERIDTNITQLELNKTIASSAADGVDVRSSKNKSTVTENWTTERQQQQQKVEKEKEEEKILHKMINEEMDSFNKRLNKLDRKIESLMQQIDLKLKFFDSNTTTATKNFHPMSENKIIMQSNINGTSDGERGQIRQKEIEPNYLNNNDSNREILNNDDEQEKEMNENTAKMKNIITETATNNDIILNDMIAITYNRNSNSKIMKVNNNNDDDDDDRAKNNEDCDNNYNKKNNITTSKVDNDEVDVDNCSNLNNKIKNRMKSFATIQTTASSIDSTESKTKHELLLEQCIDLKKLLKLFMISIGKHRDIQLNRNKKSTNQISSSKSIIKSERNPIKKGIQSENFSSDYMTEPSSSSPASPINDDQSKFDTNNNRFYGIKQQQRKQPKSRRQWSKSTPDLNSNHHHHRDHTEWQSIISNNNDFVMNRSYPKNSNHNLSSSYRRRFETIAMANEQVGRRIKISSINSHDKNNNTYKNEKSNSLLSIIKKTSNQLKQELNNLDLLGRSCNNNDNRNNNYTFNNDDDWLKSLHVGSGDSGNIEGIHSQNDRQSTTYAINNQEDQLLMFRLKLIRDSVNDRLTKISTAIQQQKITQI